MQDVESISSRTSIVFTHHQYLSFHAANLVSERTSESFSKQEVDRETRRLLAETAKTALSLLDDQFHPEALEVVLEENAEIHFPDGVVERIPVSVVVSQQRPAASQIRLGMFEMKDDPRALRSIFAHELGHMLFEWACRRAGVTKPEDFVLAHWSKPIYEGVADWVAAVTTGSTTIGSHHGWFRRGLLDYGSLEAAKATVGLPAYLVDGLKKVGLVPKYRAYSDFMAIIGEYLKDLPDPYAEGSWIAGRLFSAANGQAEAKHLCMRIIAVAITGDQFNDAKVFLKAVGVDP